MRRIDAFEFNEKAWCPRFVRDSIVETLGTGLRWGRIYDGVGPVFASFLERAGVDSVLDLCSGSGEPASILLSALERGGFALPRFVLSDLFPNEPAMAAIAARHPGRIEACLRPVDATNVPPEVDQPARMIVSALHHFPPDLVRRILADSVAKRRAIFIVEGFPRFLPRLASIVPSMAAALLSNPLTTGRDRLLKAVFTWVVPVVPACGVWDAVVSILRVHTEGELRALAEPLGGGYTWEFHELPFQPLGKATAFLGLPPR